MPAVRDYRPNPLLSPKQISQFLLDLNTTEAALDDDAHQKYERRNSVVQVNPVSQIRVG